MSFIVLIRPTRAAVELLILKDGSSAASIKGILELKHSSKGPRPFKFRVVEDGTDKIMAPSEAVDLLRMADLILVPGHGDEASEKDFLMMLGGYHLTHERVKVCRTCLSDGRFTPVDKGSIRYRGEFLCENCGLSELHREINLCGRRMGEEGIERLFQQLLWTRDLDRMLVLMDPKKMDSELTLFDEVRASSHVGLLKSKDLHVDGRLKGILPDTLLPVQSLSVASGLLKGKNQLVVSATATGKTLVGEMAGVNNILAARGKMLFLVPLVALANQKYDQFRKKYQSLGLTTAVRVGQSRIGSGKGNRMRTTLDSDIIVGTYEGIDYLLRSGGGRKLGKVGTVVMDEVHMIQDPERGPRLDGLIARLRYLYPKCQFIYLSATVGEPQRLASALGSMLIEYEERPIPLERHLIFGGPSEKLRLINQLARDEYNRKSSKGFRGQTIVFTNSRHNCHRLSDALQIRSAAYHAGLPYQQRRRIEQEFGKARLPVVVTTAALAAGVDFPASQVIFEGLAMGIEWLGQGEFLQMQGRAGRPDYHDRGVVVLMAEPDKSFGRGESEDKVAFRLLRGAVAPIAVESGEDAVLEQVAVSAVVWDDLNVIRKVESSRLGGGDVGYIAGKLQDMGYMEISGTKVRLTSMGRIMVKHFLKPEQVYVIKDGIESGLEPDEIVTGLEVFDRAFFAGADRIAASLNVRLPSRVFQGGAMEMALSGESLARLDSATQHKLVNFAKDFLSCTCKGSPYCGCPERKFSRKLMEMRGEGLSASGIIDALTARYGVFAYGGDVMEYLEFAARNLEAVGEVAVVLGDKDMVKRAEVLFGCIVG
ncbi:MAG: DEAD/DEAH box helicase [Methanosarcinales archaeon]|nr:DEAD/DEAH box helicase [Methanosarcinales archaeon]